MASTSQTTDNDGGIGKTIFGSRHHTTRSKFLNSTTLSTPVPTKPCTVCRKVKSLTDFYVLPTVRDGRRSVCKACEAEYKRVRQQTPEYKAWRHAYQSAHPETWGMDWYDNGPTEDILLELEAKYGITLER